MGEANTPAIDDGDVRIYQGDALDTLRQMPDESVHCIVTSPPLELFWGLRDYGTGTWDGGDEGCDHKALVKPRAGRTAGGLTGGTATIDAATGIYKDACGKCGARRIDHQIGLEPTPDEWCARLVDVMREARRVLRSDGVCWIEVGDTYAATTRGAGGDGKQHTNAGSVLEDRSWQIPSGLKPKDLCGAPWMLAFALRADGWYLRSDTIWARPNPMPESVTDRPTKAHSYVFLLTKSARYFYDADAIREPARGEWSGVATRNPRPGVDTNGGGQGNGRMTYPTTTANARSVWQIAGTGLVRLRRDLSEADRTAVLDALRDRGL